MAYRSWSRGQFKPEVIQLLRERGGVPEPKEPCKFVLFIWIVVIQQHILPAIEESCQLVVFFC